VDTSVLVFVPAVTTATEHAVSRLFKKGKKLVSEGRYLITVYESPSDWNGHVPIAALLIKETLGGIQNRSCDWEFFGNGAVRTYTSKTLKLTKTYQWTIVRRSGAKPYSRRKSLTSAALKLNAIPVSDTVFTRDVANNVWHLLGDNFKERVISRFSSLLTWQDEEFVVIDGGKTTSIRGRTALTLKEDLVGVPKKAPYFWESGNVLF
jgi:hypothetical protein